MKKSRTLLAGLALGLLSLIMIAGLAVFTQGQNQVSAAPAAQTTPNTTTTPSTGTPAAKPVNADQEQLRQNFLKSFAAKLGVDEAKLNSSFTSAVNDTVDQAVKDGKLTQAQADKIKNGAKNGFQGIGFGGRDGGPGGMGKGGGHMDGDVGQFFNTTLDVAAKTIGVTTDELKTSLKAGQSIADVAKSKGVELSKVKDAMLNSIKTQLDAQVKAGKMTQAQADTAYQAATTRIDAELTSTHQGGRGHK